MLYHCTDEAGRRGIEDDLHINSYVCKMPTYDSVLCGEKALPCVWFRVAPEPLKKTVYPYTSKEKWSYSLALEPRTFLLDNFHTELRAPVFNLYQLPDAPQNETKNVWKQQSFVLVYMYTPEDDRMQELVKSHAEVKDCGEVSFDEFCDLRTFFNLDDAEKEKIMYNLAIVTADGLRLNTDFYTDPASHTLIRPNADGWTKIEHVLPTQESDKENKKVYNVLAEIGLFEQGMGA